MKITEIKNVPPDEGTGIMPINIFNPTSLDFEVKWNGSVQGIIPAGKGTQLPEFLARHAAKHLAETIISRKWKVKINEESDGQITPDTAKAAPKVEVQKMMEALLKGEASAFDQMEVKIGESVAKVEPELVSARKEKPKVEEPDVVAEVAEEQKEAEKAAKLKKVRQASAAKARLVRAAKKTVAESN